MFSSHYHDIYDVNCMYLLMDGWLNYIVISSSKITICLIHIVGVRPLYIGPPHCVCPYCGAMLWIHEQTKKGSKYTPGSYSVCCMHGKVNLPLLRPPPQFLNELYMNTNVLDKEVLKNIRLYTCLFAFTSMGGNIGHGINAGGGQHVFRMSGQNIHRIGSLLPSKGGGP